MHIGGINIFAGLFYLLVCTVITVFWLNIFYLIWGLGLKGMYRLRYHIARNKWFVGQGKNPEEILKKPTWGLFNPRFLVSAAVLALLLNFSIYSFQRGTWMGGDNTHYRAKEYWVAGQVVYAHRILIGRLLHPENIILKPYTLLQRHIYTKGVSFLPKGDGESYVWKNIWFFYPYSRKAVQPYLVRDNKYSPEMAALLDDCWSTIEGLATSKIADRQMYRKYQLEYPFLVSYYSLYQGHYGGPFLMSGFRTRTSPIYADRNRQMLAWIDALYNSWEKSGLLPEIQKKYPYVNSYRQDVLMRLIKNLILPLAYFGEFSCDHPLMTRMYKEFQKAMSADPQKNVFLNLKKKNPRQASLAYKSAVYSPNGSAANCLLNHICGKEMPEEQYLLVKKFGDFNEFYNQDSVERVYKKELKFFIESREENGN